MLEFETESWSKPMRPAAAYATIPAFEFWMRLFSRKPIPAPPKTADFIDVEHDGIRHRIAVKRVAAARRFTLRVRAARGDVVLTMPAKGSAQAARTFALRHAGWVAERIGRIQPHIAFVPGAVVPLRGVHHRLVHRPGLRRRTWVDTAGSDTDPMPSLCVSGPENRFGEAVLSFLREEARRDLAAAVAGHSHAVRKPVRSITLRDTKSRWGSCTARGALNFSWRLILAPPVVLDYLAAHETAHLVHMNHSDAFWRVTRTLAPETDDAEAWLKTHGASLHHYGA